MKLTSQEYKDLLRRNPALAPDIEERCKDGIKTYQIGLRAIEEIKAAKVPLAHDSSVKQAPPHHNWLHAPYKKEFIIYPESYSMKTQAPALKFTIPGQPVGSPRQTQRDKWMKRPCVVKYRDWCSVARASVPKGASLGFYREVSFVAYMGFPESYSVNKRADLTNQPHLLKPDIDNLQKSCLDALFEQDCVIWKVYAEKRWVDSKGPRIEVELR